MAFPIVAAWQNHSWVDAFDQVKLAVNIRKNQPEDVTDMLEDCEMVVKFLACMP